MQNLNQTLDQMLALLLGSHNSRMSPEMAEAQSDYGRVEETDGDVCKVSDQSERLTRDSEEMEN